MTIAEREVQDAERAAAAAWVIADGQRIAGIASAPMAPPVSMALTAPTAPSGGRYDLVLRVRLVKDRVSKCRV